MPRRTLKMVFSPCRLRAARVARGLTRYDLGARIGMGGRTYAHYEEGVAVPPGNTLIALCLELEIKDVCELAEEVSDDQH